MANTLRLSRNGAVGFIDWLGCKLSNALLRSACLWQKADKVHDAMKKKKDQQCGEQRLHAGGSHADNGRECEERDNDADLNRMKCLHQPNRAASGVRTNVSDEP